MGWTIYRPGWFSGSLDPLQGCQSPRWSVDAVEQDGAELGDVPVVVVARDDVALVELREQVGDRELVVEASHLGKLLAGESLVVGRVLEGYDHLELGAVNG